jgi:hypothetical protein
MCSIPFHYLDNNFVYCPSGKVTARYFKSFIFLQYCIQSSKVQYEAIVVLALMETEWAQRKGLLIGARRSEKMREKS